MSASREHALEASIRQACKELRMPTIGARAGALAQEAVRAKQSHLPYLSALLEAELDDRAERRRQRRITEARFPRLKRVEEFSFEDAPGIPAATIADLLACDYIKRREGVIFLGDSGTGKSHLASALGIAACMKSHRVRFTTAAGLVNELLEAREQRALSKVVARYARFELLILDELAYVPLTPTEAELLFQVLDARSEVASIVTTTNLPFSEWTSVFPEPRLCKAVVDRLTFNAHIIETGTESYRFKKTAQIRRREEVTRKDGRSRRA